MCQLTLFEENFSGTEGALLKSLTCVALDSSCLLFYKFTLPGVVTVAMIVTFVIEAVEKMIILFSVSA